MLYFSLKKLGPTVILVSCLWKVPDFSFGPEICYPDSSISVFCVASNAGIVSQTVPQLLPLTIQFISH
jgi:hypothetical protein